MMNDTRNVTGTPRAWVGCLACYNAGLLVGEWVDGIEAGEVTPEDIHPGTFTTQPVGLNPATHDELWVFDHEGYGALIPGGCSPAEAQRVAELIEPVPERDREAFVAYVENVGAEYADAGDFEETFVGEWNTFEDYAYELGDVLGLVPADAPREVILYFAWDRWARDLLLGGDYWTAPASDGGVFVFRAV